MAKSSVRHPKITPLRAFELLRALDRDQGRLGAGTTVASARTSRALAEHVRAALVRGRR